MELWKKQTPLPQIVAQPLVILLLAIPIRFQVFFNSGLAYWLNRKVKSPHCVTGPSALRGRAAASPGRRSRPPALSSLLKRHEAGIDPEFAARGALTRLTGLGHAIKHA